MYKYFKENEIKGLTENLCKMLDTAREVSGIPFKITSGFRTVQENTLAGGVANSAHLTGEAVDISCENPRMRALILKGLFVAGFVRIGVYATHIHADCSNVLPQNVVWLDAEKA